MASSTCASPPHPPPPLEQEQEQEQPPPFTFASSVPSETYEDHAPDFDYESWIQQSKIDICSSYNLWTMDNTESSEAIKRHHREMMLRAADNLPEEAYELSLRDLTELSLPVRPTTTPPPSSSTNPPCRRHKTSSPATAMQGAAGFIINLFMPSPGRPAPAGRRKSFSGTSTASVLPKKSENDSRSNDGMPRTSMSYHDRAERKSMSCYPLFSTSKYKAKRAASGHFCM